MRGHNGKKRESHPAWKGGRRFDKDGYVLVYAPDHQWPRRGGYIREHVFVMENALSRRMKPGECVHHKDHDRQNNSVENLEIIQRGQHSKLHRHEDAHTFKRDEKGRFKKCGSI